MQLASFVSESYFWLLLPEGSQGKVTFPLLHRRSLQNAYAPIEYFILNGVCVGLRAGVMCRLGVGLADCVDLATLICFRINWH